MANKNPFAPPPPKPYEILATRLQRAINNPTAQKSKSALLERLGGDCDEAWQRIMGELAVTDNVTLAHRDDGHLQIFWTVVQDD